MKFSKAKLAMVTVGIAVCIIATANYQKNKNRLQDDRSLDENGKAIFAKIAAKFTDVNRPLFVSGSVTLTDSGKIKEHTTFQLIREGKFLYHRFDAIQQICNDEISVQLDTINKYMFLQKPLSEDREKKKSTDLFFQRALNDTSICQITAKKEGGKAILEIVNDFQPEIKSCKIVYKPDTYEVENTTIEWWRDPVARDGDYFETRIDYLYKSLGEIPLNKLLESIVKVNNDKVDINSHYASYHVEIR